MKIITSNDLDAQEIMDLDAATLASLESESILHLYNWTGVALTYGHFIKVEKFIDLERAADRQVQLARRPTGGGIVLHTNDLSFSFFLPASHKNYSRHSLDNYKFINQIVIEAILEILPSYSDLINIDLSEQHASRPSFCMAEPSKYDIFFSNKKIGGAAQRNKKQGYLHQATLNLVESRQALIHEVLIEGKEMARVMKENSSSLLGESSRERDGFKKELEEKLIAFFSQV